MKPTVRPDLLLALPENELLFQLEEIDGLTAFFQELLEEVYAEDELTAEREILHQETCLMSHGIRSFTAEMQQPDPERLSDLRLKLILKLRVALRKAFQTKDTQDTAIDQIIAIADGDLAHTTYYWAGGMASTPIILGHADNIDHVENFRFSPELQKQIATSNAFKSILN